MFVIRKANLSDLDAMQKILKQASLETGGIEESFDHFFVVEEPDLSLLVGVVGMEVHEPYGLLRSFVLEKKVWNLEVIWRLFQVLFSYAKRLKLSSLYLIASSATEWFQLIGFSKVDKKAIPQEILELEHSKRNLANGTMMVYDDLIDRKQTKDER